MLKFVLSNLDCFNKNYNSFNTSKLLSFDAPSSKIVNATTRVFSAGHGAVHGAVLRYKRLMGMCPWIGSHFHRWIDYSGVANFRILRIKTVHHIYV